jgi:hypothetical protein
MRGNPMMFVSRHVPTITIVCALQGAVGFKHGPEKPLTRERDPERGAIVFDKMACLVSEASSDARRLPVLAPHGCEAVPITSLAEGEPAIAVRAEPHPQHAARETVLLPKPAFSEFDVSNGRWRYRLKH